jgi:hypothetical protein
LEYRDGDALAPSGDDLTLNQSEFSDEPRGLTAQLDFGSIYQTIQHLNFTLGKN